jgi:hypothetical protein
MRENMKCRKKQRGRKRQEYKTKEERKKERIKSEGLKTGVYCSLSVMYI